MKLAKPNIDIGLFTNQRDQQLSFWKDVAGLDFDHTLKLGGGVLQHRFTMHGVVVKVNDARNPLPEQPVSAILGLSIAQEGLQQSETKIDPDGNTLTLVPKGTQGIATIALTLASFDPAASIQFYTQALGMEKIDGKTLRSGESIIFLQSDFRQRPAGVLAGKGFRYFTVQVHNCDEAHSHALAMGAREGRPPMTLGATARVSFILDPDGTWIELSERASLTGVPVSH
jgi:predicted enzyme related to lactoylglutathione lyase